VSIPKKRQTSLRVAVVVTFLHSAPN